MLNNMKKVRHMQYLLAMISLSVLTVNCSSFFSDNKCAPIQHFFVDRNFQVDVSKYSSRPDSQKSLLILPPTGGTNYIDRSYAKTFCEQGYNVYILNHWTEDQETESDLEIHQKFYGKAQRAVNLTLQQIKTPYIGMIGTSVGALHASISASLADQLNTVFVIVGGTPIAEVVTTSDQKAMKDLHEERTKRFGFENDQEMIAGIDKAFDLEPIELDQGFKNKSLGMIIAKKDSTVATRTQEKLREFWNPKKVIYINSGHFWAIVKAWFFYDEEILQFFEENNTTAKK
jgi:hypothetical protein